MPDGLDAVVLANMVREAIQQVQDVRVLLHPESRIRVTRSLVQLQNKLLLIERYVSQLDLPF